MPDTICPLLLATKALSASDDVKRCRGEKCEWFLHVEGRPGGVGSCSIKKIASYLTTQT